jgi:hypothetical protein
VTVKGFKECCISSAMDGTGDDMLWNDSEEVGNVRSECEENEGTDCEYGHSDTA